MASKSLQLSKQEAEILCHALEAPDSLSSEEDSYVDDVFERRCETLAEHAAGGLLEIRDDLDVEILMRAAEQNTFIACIAGGSRTEIARAVKAVYSLQRKLSAALDRDVVIPCE